MVRHTVSGFVAALLLTAAAWWLPGAAAPAFAAEKGCVGCHDRLGKAAASGRHAEYHGSVHERAGVGCDACHGGDPAASDAKAAHRGVLPPSDRNSRIHFQKVPDTCGACHTAQRNGFVTSRHYRKLEGSGEGPNCVTCHGSMATRVLGPDTIEQFCVACHSPKRAAKTGAPPEKPWEAATALNLMAQADTLTQWAGEFAKMAGKTPPQLADARRELAAARTAWHTFNLETVRAHTRKSTAAAIAARESLR